MQIHSQTNMSQAPGTNDVPNSVVGAPKVNQEPPASLPSVEKTLDAPVEASPSATNQKEKKTENRVSAKVEAPSTEKPVTNSQSKDNVTVKEPIETNTKVEGEAEVTPEGNESVKAPTEEKKEEEVELTAEQLQDSIDILRRLRRDLHAEKQSIDITSAMGQKVWDEEGTNADHLGNLKAMRRQIRLIFGGIADDMDSVNEIATNLQSPENRSKTRPKSVHKKDQVNDDEESLIGVPLKVQQSNRNYIMSITRGNPKELLTVKSPSPSKRVKEHESPKQCCAPIEDNHSTDCSDKARVNSSPVRSLQPNHAAQLERIQNMMLQQQSLLHEKMQQYKEVKEQQVRALQTRIAELEEEVTYYKTISQRNFLPNIHAKPNQPPVTVERKWSKQSDAQDALDQLDLSFGLVERKKAPWERNNLFRH